MASSLQAGTRGAQRERKCVHVRDQGHFLACRQMSLGPGRGGTWGKELVGRSDPGSGRYTGLAGSFPVNKAKALGRVEGESTSHLCDIWQVTV